MNKLEQIIKVSTMDEAVKLIVNSQQLTRQFF